MVFNVVYANIDNHLKNHSFIYQKEYNAWELASTYDLIYPLNVNLKYSNVSRSLSINGKRSGNIRNDSMSLAETHAVRGAKGIIKKVQEAGKGWEDIALQIPENVAKDIAKEFTGMILVDSFTFLSS